MSTTRTIITLPEETKAWLESYSKINGISMAEAIRKGIICLRKEEDKSTYRSLMRKTKGIWSKGDGLKYQNQIRDDWE